MKKIAVFLLLSWLFLGLISGRVDAGLPRQAEQVTPTATPAPPLVVTSFTVYPESVVAGDQFQVAVGLENNHAGSIGYLSATITDINNDADLRSAVSSKIFLLPNLAQAERRLFTFDFTYEMGSSGVRELSLVLDFVYLVDNKEVNGSQRAFLPLNVLEPTPTPTLTATITPAVTQTPAPVATPMPTPTSTSSPQFTVSSTLGINIRSGPGEAYSVIGGGALDQSFPVVGKNVDATWWQIEFSGGTGWVWHELGTVQNPDGVKLVEDISPPPTPIPTPVPSVTEASSSPLTRTPSPATMPDDTIQDGTGTDGSSPSGAQRDALVVELSGMPVSVAPGTTFPVTFTVHNVSPVTVTETVVMWDEQNSAIIPVGVGTTWFLNSIPPGGKKVVSSTQLYVTEDAAWGPQRIEVTVDHAGTENPVHGVAYFLVKTEAPESFWLRLLRFLSGRTQSRAEP